jgi:hypothetical protein
MAKKRAASKAQAPPCDHPKSERKVIGGGLHKCGRCDAVRGVDDVWRRDGKVVAS